MNMFDYRLYVFHTLFGTVLLSGPKNSLVTRGAARKYVICWRVKNIQREKNMPTLRQTGEAFKLFL